MNLGQLSNYTNPELIAALEPTMHRSPIILELVKRLQAAHDNDVALESVADKVECPVCLANLQASVDTGNNRFELAFHNP